ncbi:hypothetical protein MY8738_009703 [Beauveria namnaoensis]
MALDLCIHACIQKPRHRLHPPPANTPLRIRIQGPLETIEKLLPDVKWHNIVSFPQPGGVELARLTHEALYGKEVHAETRCRLVVRDEYLAWAMSERRPLSYIDYYGVTFDHLVSPDDPDPEVLVINIIELDSVGGIYSDGGDLASSDKIWQSARSLRPGRTLNTSLFRILMSAAGREQHTLWHMGRGSWRTELTRLVHN